MYLSELFKKEDLIMNVSSVLLFIQGYVVLVAVPLYILNPLKNFKAWSILKQYIENEFAVNN